jgi:xanthine/uracil permease
MVFGLQWFVVVVPYIIILGMIAAGIHYADSPGLQLKYLQKLFLATGLTLVIQVMWGHRLPLVIGPAAVLLSGIVANRGEATIGAVYLSVALCGGVLAALSWCKWLSRIQVLFTNRVIGIVLVLIAFTILPTILQLIVAGTDNPFSQLVFAVMLVMAMLIGQRFLPGVLKSTIVIWALLVGSLAYYAFWTNAWPAVAAPAQIAADWELAAIGFEFDGVTVLSFLFCFLALTANDIGSIQSTAGLLAVEDSGQRSRSGLIVTGLGNFLAGCLGVMGPVNYSFSSGIIIATGCAARFPLAVAGAGMILLAGMPGIISLFSYIPAVVTGSLLFYTMCSQTAGGLMMLGKCLESSGFESGLIIGVSLMLGTLIAFMPAAMAATIPPIIRPLATNGFVVGVTTALILEHVVFSQWVHTEK